MGKDIWAAEWTGIILLFSFVVRINAVAFLRRDVSDWKTAVTSAVLLFAAFMLLRSVV